MNTEMGRTVAVFIPPGVPAEQVEKFEREIAELAHAVEGHDLLVVGEAGDVLGAATGKVYELLAAERAEIEMVFADHDPVAFTRRLAERVAAGLLAAGEPDAISAELIGLCAKSLDESLRNPSRTAGDPVTFERWRAQITAVQEGIEAGRGVDLALLDGDVLEWLNRLQHVPDFVLDPVMDR